MDCLSSTTGGTAERPSLLFLVRLIAVLGLAAAFALPARSIAAEPIHIAIALPQSGPWQLIGKDAKKAALLAMQKYQLQVGPDAAAVELSFYDDGCSVDGGAQIARQISALDAKPLAVVGHACPSAAQSAAPIYAAANIIFISAGLLPARQSILRRFGSLQFSLPHEGSQATLIASTLFDAGDVRIAIVRDRTQYAIEATQAILSALGAASRNVVVQESFAGGDKDFAALAQRIQSASVSHVILSAFPSEAGLLIGELRKANPAVTILATDQLAEPGFAHSFPTASEGVLVPLPVDYDDLPSARNLAQQIHPSNAASARVALATHAALECLLSVLREQHPWSTAEVANALTTRQFDTTLGPVRFDAAGSASLSKFGLFTWHKGQLLSATTAPGVATQTRLP